MDGAEVTPNGKRVYLYKPLCVCLWLLGHDTPPSISVAGMYGSNLLLKMFYLQLGTQKDPQVLEEGTYPLLNMGL